MKYLIVCSSSGGHVYPGLNFGEYLKKCGEEVKFLGIKGEIEERIISKDDLITISMEKSFKKGLKHPLKTYKTINQINNIIKDYDVIVGFGGFITFMVSLAPSIKQKAFYLHEANLDLGDSNKYALRRAKKVFTSYKDTLINHPKTVYVGNPVVDSLKKSSDKREFISFIFGSLGSKSLLEITYNYLINQNDDNKYLLVTSKKYYDEYQEKLSKKKNVIVYDYIDKNQLYNVSKIIFCRGGASTLAEVMASHVNCVCIPSPYVKHNHQYRNAEYLFIHHALILVEEKELNNEKIQECLKLYQSNYGAMELQNQKSLEFQDVSLKMHLTIKNDNHL